MEDASYWFDLLRPTFAGQKIIACGDALAAAFSVAKSLERFEIPKPLLIAGTRGTGTQPTTDEADVVILGTSGNTMMDGIRAFENALAEPSPELLRAVDAYDPDRKAIVLGTIFARDGEIWGRRSLGGRPASWERIEDKMLVDEVLDDAGIARAPSAIVGADERVRDAFVRLDRGLGCAIAGDAKEGWWGGAEYLRWARTADELPDALSFLGAHCDRVRVMPFLEGIPCSIHGMVFADTEIAFRPVEMLVLRRPTSSLLYAGLATYWDPPDADRDAMREAALRLGSHLRDRVGYRGVFTLDGVLTSDGFRPTEINARPGAGLSPQVAASKLNIPLLSRLVCSDDSLDFRPRELEELIVSKADEHRSGSCYTVLPGDERDDAIHAVMDDGTSFTPIDDTEADDTEGADGGFVLGPSTAGGFMRYQPNPERVPRGPSFAPTAVRAFAFADDHLGTSLGPLEAAKPVR